MVEKKEDYSQTSYLLGIISIVLSIFTPLAGFIFGIIGLSHSKKQSTQLSKRAKKLNVIGITISIILFIVYVTLAIYAVQNPEILNNGAFPY